MFFGRYLLNNGVIDSNQLIEAICLQFESLPSLVRLMKRQGLLSDNQILDLVDKNIESGKSLMQLIRENQLLEVDQIEKLYDDQFKEGKGLAQALVQLGYVNVSQLDGYIKEYLINRPESSAGVTESAPVCASESQEKSTPSTGISAAALESLKEVGMISSQEISELESETGMKLSKEQDHRPTSSSEEGILKFDMSGEFLKVFNENLFAKMNEELTALDNAFDEEVVENVYQELHLILGAGNLAGLKFITRLLQSWDEVFEQIAKQGQDFPSANFSSVTKGLKEALDLAWELRNEIERCKSEARPFKNVDWKNKYLNNLKAGISHGRQA